jgi:cytochrome c-type biogenesis protein CcmH/NrfG
VWRPNIRQIARTGKPVVRLAGVCYTPAMTRDDATRSVPASRPLLVGAVVVLGVPLAAGALGGTGWSWGWDHLHRMPAAWPLFLALLSAALCVPAWRRRFLSAWAACGEALARHPLLVPAVAAAMALGAFLAFPVATRMYGDTLAILNHHGPDDLARHLGRVLEPGIATRGSAVALVHDLVERATGLSYVASYRLVSSLCGAAFVLLHLRLAATLPGLHGWARATIAWLGLVDGANQLFFGHVENYTLPRLAATWFLVSLAPLLLAPPERPSLRRARAYLPLAVAVFLHWQWLVLLPAALLAVLRDVACSRPRLRAWSGGRAALALVGVFLVMAVGAWMVTGAWCYDYLYTGGLPEPRQVLLPVSTACVAQPWLHYTLFSGPHLLDFAGSLWSLSSPAVLLAIVLLWSRAWRPAAAHVTAVAAVAALLHDLCLNPSIGYPFDWDLMCVVSPPLLYTAVLLVAAAGRRPGQESGVARAPGWVAPAFVLGLAAATVFAVNAGERSSYARVEDMAVWLHRSYYGSSHYRLNGNLGSIADPARQDAERERVLARLRPQAYPDDREIAFLWEKLGRQRAERREFAAALTAYREALRVEPSNWMRRKEAGWLETEAGDEATGVNLLGEYLGRAPADAEAWRHLGVVHARRGRDAEARTAWERFLQLAPDTPEAEQVRHDLQQLDAVATPR